MSQVNRQIVLDTETTGLEPENGHRIIEIGCVEIINRRLTGRHYHQYLQPDREIDLAAAEVHGITEEFLRDKPRFIDIVEDFIAFIRGAELIIHNAPFDIGFLEHELKQCGSMHASISNLCAVTDTLRMARKMHPGQKNNLNALCKRYAIDNSQRSLHGALLDAEILADVYLAMTGGQTSLSLDTAVGSAKQLMDGISVQRANLKLLIVRADEREIEAHRNILDILRQGGDCLWDRFQPQE